MRICVHHRSKTSYLLKYLISNSQHHAEMEKVIPLQGEAGAQEVHEEQAKQVGHQVRPLAGQSGYVHSFNIIGDNLLVTEGTGATGQTVLNLMETLEQGTEVFFFNYCMGIPFFRGISIT